MDSQTILECRAAALAPLKPYFFDALLDGGMPNGEATFSSFAAQLGADGQLDGTQPESSQAPMSLSRCTVKAEMTRQLMALLKLDVDCLDEVFRSVHLLRFHDHGLHWLLALTP